MTTEISRRKLAGTQPRETDKSIRSQASQLGICLSVKFKTRFLPGGGVHDVPTGCDLHGNTAKLAEVAQITQAAMESAPYTEIVKWLAELSALVIRRNFDEFGVKIEIEAYSRRLADYPADVAYHALLIKTWKFWPSWAELKEVCDQLVSTRRVMLRAVQGQAAQFDETDANRERATKEEVEQILKDTRFDPKRMNGRPICSHEEQDADTEREPHWYETASPNSPEVAALHKARQENELIRQSRDAMAKATSAERKASNG